MRLPARFDIVWPWVAANLRGKTTGVSAVDVIKYLTRPSKRQRGGRYVKAVEHDGDFWRICFHGLPDPLYWPAKFDLDWVYDFIDEQFNPQNWHQYEIDSTRVDQNDIVFDCGASEGLFSLRVARRCRKVIALEPLPDFQPALARTFARVSNVEIVPLAVGRDRRTVHFHPAAGGSVKAAAGEIEVEQTSLDEITRDRNEHVDFLKVDIEGAEMEMLEGARETLIRDLPKIAMTTYHRKGDSKRFTEFLRSLDVGYQTTTKGINGVGEPVMLHAWANPR
jgi:FkbM family methyltransferase